MGMNALGARALQNRLGIKGKYELRQLEKQQQRIDEGLAKEGLLKNIAGKVFRTAGLLVGGEVGATIGDIIGTKGVDMIMKNDERRLHSAGDFYAGRISEYNTMLDRWNKEQDLADTINIGMDTVTSFTKHNYNDIMENGLGAFTDKDNWLSFDGNETMLGKILGKLVGPSANEFIDSGASAGAA